MIPLESTDAVKMEENQAKEAKTTVKADEENAWKIHISRVPTQFTEQVVWRILADSLWKDDEECSTQERESLMKVELILQKEDDDENGKASNSFLQKQQQHQQQRAAHFDYQYRQYENPHAHRQQHRGFGFVTLGTQALYDKALSLSTIKGGKKATSKRLHIMHLRAYSEKESETNVCYLWSQHRCPYGENCKFEHVGPGACQETSASQPTPLDHRAAMKKRRGKCFAYKKGKCTKGDDCPFSHDFPLPSKTKDADEKQCLPVVIRPDCEKDCINWKTKGKCRKGETCPYKHDPQILKKLMKKKKKQKRQRQMQEIQQQRDGIVMGDGNEDIATTLARQREQQLDQDTKRRRGSYG